MYSKKRILFIQYSEFAQQSLNKLFKISDEIAVFIHSDMDSIPIERVISAQDHGKQIHWINIPGENNQEMMASIAFELGQRHRTEEIKKEFAVYLEEDGLDHIISHINECGRTCIRVKNDTPKIDQTPDLFINLGATSDEGVNLDAVSLEDTVLRSDEILSGNKSIVLERKTDLVHTLARKTLDRLIESGNRPAQVSTLKSYILLNNQETNIHNRIDDIIQHLNTFKEIEIVEDNIVYNLD